MTRKIDSGSTKKTPKETKTPKAVVTTEPVTTATTPEPAKTIETTPVMTAQAPDAISEKLMDMGVEVGVIEKIKTDLGAKTVEQLSGLTEVDLVEKCGMKTLPARDLIKKLTASAVTEQIARGAEAAEASAASATSMLEPIPSDEALLSSLKVGGVMKVDYARVIMAGRCLLARQMNMYGADKRIIDMINDYYTNVREEPNPQIFWELSGERTKNRYAPIFNALKMPGASAYATAPGRNAFWAKMNEIFIPKVQEVQRQLTVWYDSWLKQAQANIGLNLGAALAGSAGGTMVPRQRMPVITNILAAVDAMIDAANKVFAGQNEVVAIALAIDAQRLRNLLARNDLHTFTGSSSREIMLKELGVAATSDIIAMENNFSTYLHNAPRIQLLPSTGPTTATFLQELQEIGESIDWARLSKKIDTKANSGSLTGIGGRGGSADGELPDDEELWK